jgi:hypothetical protein
MTLVKKILAVLLVVFVVIQFIQPGRNKSDGPMPDDISTLVSVAGSVMSLLHRACYDCHSNNTGYPWYMNVQPMGWLMAKHVREGKEELNFSEFAGYSRRRQVSKLKAIGSSVKDGTMPLPSYTLMHADARLSGLEKKIIINWVTQTMDSVQAAH